MSGYPNSSQPFPPGPWSMPAGMVPGNTAHGGNDGNPPMGRRPTARTAGDPYQAALARRRANTPAAARQPGPRGPRARDSEGEEPREARKRVVVACARCRKRKIRCSGEDANGGACTNCKGANEPHCVFLRVNASNVGVRPKEETGWTGPSFNYDIDACRQVQSRGSAVMPALSLPQQQTAYTGPVGGMGGPVNMYQQGIMYNWGGGAGAAGYNGEGSGAATNMGYGMYQQQYHGIPSPDASYLGESDLVEPAAPTSLAEDGAFALQSMSHGLPGGGNNRHHTALFGNGPVAPTTTPRSLPGPPNVLGSSRVPTSSVFTRPSYPSPATTPIANGVSPGWSGYDSSPYEQGPYTTMAAPVPSTMAAQSLERLPDLYSATPPPTRESAVGGAPTSQSEGSMSGGEDGHPFGFGSGELAPGRGGEDGTGDDVVNASGPGGI